MYYFNMGKWIHRLVELDKNTGAAICIECGPIQATWKTGANAWRCSTAVRNHKQVSAGMLFETKADRDRKLEEQGYRCAICKSFGRLERDHDHATGFDRGYLCAFCNRGLGQFRDNPELLESAAEYLRFHTR